MRPHGPNRRLLLLAAAIALAAAPASAQVIEGDEDEAGPSLERIAVPFEFERPFGRGPLPIRDSMPLAAMRLALHPFSPETTPVGEPRGRVEVTWGNTFLSGSEAIVDAETARAAFEVRDGVTDTVDAGIEIPLVYRGGGTLDGIANFLHDAFSFPDGDRGEAPDDRHEIAVLDDGNLAELDDGTGLGDVVISSKAMLADGLDGSYASSLLGELRLPTAEDDLGADGIDVGLAVGLSGRLLDSVIAYGGAGGTYFSDARHEGIEYEPFRAYGFAAIEWQALDWVSLLVQADVATPLLEGPDEIDGWQSYVHFGAVVDVFDDARLELAFVENIEDQHSTADFALFAGLGFRF